MAAHGLLEAPHIGVHIGVEEPQEQGEVRGVSPVPGGGQEEQVVGLLGEELAEPVPFGLVLGVPGAHAVGLVHDHQVPPRPPEALLHLVPLGPVDGGDHLVPVEPGIGAVRVPQVHAPQDVEPLVEPVPHLPLPLEGEVGRRHDRRRLDQAWQLELPEEEPGHDGLAGPGVVGQEEPDPGQGSMKSYTASTW